MSSSRCGANPQPDTQHKLPVVEQLEAALHTDALVTLAATRTFPVKYPPSGRR